MNNIGGEKKYFNPDHDNNKSENEEMQLALGNMDQKERPLTPEEKEEYDKIKNGAENVIGSFHLKRSADNKKGENLLVITDSGVDELVLRAISETGKKAAGNDCRILVAPKTEHAAQDFGKTIGEKMKTSDAVLLVTSLSRTHSSETKDLIHPKHSAETIELLINSPALANQFQTLRGKYSSVELAEMVSEKKTDKSSMFPSRSRIISITNAQREIFTQGGVSENSFEMAERIEKFEKIMEGVEKVRITSENGTQLELDIKVPSLMKETGIVDRPGQGSNFPAGEYGGSVDQKGTNGIYVVDGAVGMIGVVDEPIKITFRNGLAISIEGGESAEKLKVILDKTNEEYREKHPDDKITDAYKIAEFSFGMNSKAFRIDANGNKVSPPTSLEGEKGLGTIHIALGKNTIFEVKKDDPDYNDIPIHIDLVAMKTNVIGIKEDGEEIEILKNGEIVCL